jgi:dual specificity tyrosine-phosphorylation-regulated kinase 2/3/4
LPAVLGGSFGTHLSSFERQEILDYPSVHHVGQGSKKKQATIDVTTNNYGYDDERGDYLVVEHDHLAYRYEIIDTLGKGSFGQVLHCRDHATGTSVAIKIIRNKKRFHHQALVEIKILENLRKWVCSASFLRVSSCNLHCQDPDEKHHVIKMTEHFYFRSHLCIAMELLSINLYELIKANGFVGFTTNLIRRFTSQMLASLALMRQHRIVHCDLKPEVRGLTGINDGQSVISSIRTFFSVILRRVASRSLTLEVAALNTRKVRSLIQGNRRLLSVDP